MLGQMIIIGIAILALLCFYDIRSIRRQNTNLYQFFLMGGELKIPGFLAAILSANLSIGNFLIFIASWGYLFGWGGLGWFIVNLCLNVAGFLLFLPSFRDYLEDRNNSGTVHEFISSRFASLPSENQYANRIRFVASTATVFGLLLALAFELHLANEIIAPLINVDKVVLFCLLTLLICLYTALGGFRTLVRSDIVQSVAMLIGLFCLFPLFNSSSGWWGAITSTYPLTAESINIGLPNIIGICVVGSG